MGDKMNVAELVRQVGIAVNEAVWVRSEVPPEATDCFRGIVPGKWVISVVSWKDKEGTEWCDGIATDLTCHAVRLLPSQAKLAVQLARKARLQS